MIGFVIRIPTKVLIFRYISLYSTLKIVLNSLTEHHILNGIAINNFRVGIPIPTSRIFTIHVFPQLEKKVLFPYILKGVNSLF